MCTWVIIWFFGPSLQLKIFRSSHKSILIQTIIIIDARVTNWIVFNKKLMSLNGILNCLMVIINVIGKTIRTCQNHWTQQKRWHDRADVTQAWQFANQKSTNIKHKRNKENKKIGAIHTCLPWSHFVIPMLLQPTKIREFKLNFRHNIGSLFSLR